MSLAGSLPSWRLRSLVCHNATCFHSNRTGLPSQHFFLSFLDFNILPTEKGSTVAVLKAHFLILKLNSTLCTQHTQKKNQLKEFAPAGFLLNTSEFFVANETWNIWRSFPTRQGFKKYKYKSSGTCRYFLQYSGTFVMKNGTAKRSALQRMHAPASTIGAIVLSGHFHVRVWFSSNP